MMDATDPELLVAPLLEPTAPPWGDDGAAATAEEAGNAGTEEAPELLSHDDAVEMLVGVVQVPFALAALFRGRHWELTDPEALAIARPLARAIPPAWLTSRAMAASPWLVVATATYSAVTARLAADVAIAAAAVEKEPEKDVTPADSPAPSRPGPAGRRGRAADLGEARPSQAANPGAFEGAGLGLGLADAGNDSGRRPGRGRSNNGRFTASPAN